jgi:hypothetical protein
VYLLAPLAGQWAALDKELSVIQKAHAHKLQRATRWEMIPELMDIHNIFPVGMSMITEPHQSRIDRIRKLCGNTLGLGKREHQRKSSSEEEGYSPTASSNSLGGGRGSSIIIF